MPTWWGGRSRDGGREKERRESGLAPTVAVVAYAAHGPALGDAKGRVEGEEDTSGSERPGGCLQAREGKKWGGQGPRPAPPQVCGQEGCQAGRSPACGRDVWGIKTRNRRGATHLHNDSAGICYVLVQLPAQRRWRGRRKPAGHGCAGVISVAGFLGTLNKPQDRPRV